MIENKNDSNTYNAPDIQRYLNGKMSETEMHALELAALEDPFLADAIDGYEERKSDGINDFTEDINELRDKLELRLESKSKSKIVPFYKQSWYRVAAIVLIVTGLLTALFDRTINYQSSNDIVITNTRAPEIKSVLDDTSSKETLNKIDSTSVAVTDNNLKKLRLNSSPTDYKSKDKAYSKMKATSPSTAPLKDIASAPVMAPSLSKKQPDSLIASNPDDHVAVLSEERVSRSMQTREVSKKRAEEADASPAFFLISRDAEPVIGIVAFNRYIESNKKIPDSTIVHGEVVVSFIVNQDGAISDYKIEKSLSKQADNESIRLIKEGPVWKGQKNRKSVATVTIKF